MEKTVYSCDQSAFPLDKVDPHALYILEKLRSAGHSAFLVGGSVRDILLQNKPKDFDISTSAEPEEVKKIFRNCILIGRRFRLAHIRFGKKIIEVATFRSGDPETEDLILRDNEWGTPEEDALRRDFTINGLFYDPATQTIIDYVGGYPDIQKKLLKTIGQPHLRFKQDPVRMIRLLKFQARFGFEVAEEVHVALLENRHQILKSSPARILEELLKMLESGRSRHFFQLLTEYGFTDLLLPLLGKFLEGAQAELIYSYLEEIDLSVKNPEEATLDRSVMLSSFLFPLLENRIKVHYLDRNKKPHLGEIQNEVLDLIDDLFKPFLILSRRLKVSLAIILTSQYRFTPLEKRKSHHHRIPNDPLFPLALSFFKLRASLEPGLQQIWKEWEQDYSAKSKKNKRSFSRRRFHDKP